LEKKKKNLKRGEGGKPQLLLEQNNELGWIKKKIKKWKNEKEKGIQEEEKEI